MENKDILLGKEFNQWIEKEEYGKDKELDTSYDLKLDFGTYSVIANNSNN